MASAGLTRPADYAGLFRRRILHNAHYWHDFVAGHSSDVLVLDREREGIVTAVTFALDLQAEAWPVVYELMARFSPHLERRGHWEGWNPLLERAIRWAERSGDLAAAVNLSVLLARLCQRQSRLADTIRHYRRVMRLARRLNDDFSLGRACTNLGYLYIERGRWRRAEILCCRALALFERLNNDYGCAHTENHLGLLYSWQGLWQQARQRLERACSLWQALDDNHGLMRGYINLGVLYVEMERPDEGLVYLDKAFQQAQLTGEEGEIGKIYVNIGFAYQLKGQSAQAEAYALQAEAIFKRFSNSVGLADVWSNLGLIYLDQGNWQKARLYLRASLNMWRSLENRFGEIKTLLYLAKYTLARGRRRQAAAQLDKLERLIQQYGETMQQRPLQVLLAKYRQDLGTDSTKTSGGKA